MGVKNTASKNRIVLSKSGEEKRAIRYFLKIFLSHFLHCSPVAQWIAIHLEIGREVQVIPVNRYELVAIIKTARNTGLFYRVFLQSFSTEFFYRIYIAIYLLLRFYWFENYFNPVNQCVTVEGKNYNYIWLMEK